ncbi:hypothetical protein CQR47_0571 [Bifidobacterium thermophilum]|uniref:Uncharacterized protein n=1 Tax=Bifidobacterium thermophilum TaxID=33905 RepID=A0A2N3QM50_9BIFI|nr:hypothetical protein CQR47_0571 [Bifidobacterium thermophilum]
MTTQATKLKGIIPACAGNTASPCLQRASSRDHPRMCGEHAIFAKNDSISTGSSPHVRGTRPVLSVSPADIGIIPACAGNTNRRFCTSSRLRDHPRMCGEHTYAIPYGASMGGSSPHVRGTRGPDVGHLPATGIIPACAGNTRLATNRRFRPRDHPRMCGEHGMFPLMLFFRLGSSPHVRGTLNQLRESFNQAGIIPACAGNTSDNPRGFGFGGDHPRMCGEHLTTQAYGGIVLGSSPHVRGTHIDEAHIYREIGIIPACAGNTHGRVTLFVLCQDHPRMCGEHFYDSTRR